MHLTRTQVGGKGLKILLLLELTLERLIGLNPLDLEYQEVLGSKKRGES